MFWSQITDSSIVVSPALHNGLVLLHLFDYCVPPVKLDLLDSTKQHQQQQHHLQEKLIYSWLPASTAKIHVAGINSILVGFDDDKLEINTRLNVYVQISDANGNLIKTKYFPLMNLVAKLVNSETASSSGSSSSNSKTSDSSTSSSQQPKIDMLATIDLSTLEQQQQTLALNNQDREYTAIYVLNAVKPGLVSIQFEAHSDGYLDRVGNEKSGTQQQQQQPNLIKSLIKEIQIFTPLQVQPKYIELIRDAYYQVTLSGGPNSADSSIRYEVVATSSKSNMASAATAAGGKQVIDVDVSLGILKALELGEVTVTVKSVGSACLPFTVSTVDATLAQFRCHAENRVQRVYSQDFFIVKVVELRSVSIQAPLRSIKKGNEMPVYLMANERTLSPLNFASAPHLKYMWKVNDHQIGTLQHPLLHTAKPEDHLTAESDDDAQLLLENSFSLRFSARQSGIVKLSVRLEYFNQQTNKLDVLADSVDILVFDSPHFTHFPFSYFFFKYPQLKSSLCVAGGKADHSEQHAFNQILMSPGTEFQVKTNYDKVASKISYKLRLYDQFSTVESGQQQQQQQQQQSTSITKSYCNNSTISVSATGLIRIAHLKSTKLKYLQECSANLLVTILINEHSPPSSASSSASSVSASAGGSSSSAFFKQQTLTFTIKVKPIAYTMLKLKRNSITKLSDSLVNNKIKLDRRVLIKNKLSLTEPDIQMKWHVGYYDSLGDSFDIVSTANFYTLNRNDLVGFSQLNTNLFTFAPILTTSNSVYAGGQADYDDASRFPANSLMCNSMENVFALKSNRPGRFVMEFTPSSAVNAVESRDYLGLNINEFVEGVQEFNSYHSKLETNVGDFICLSNREGDLSDDDEDLDGEKETSRDRDGVISNWLSQAASVVKILPITLTKDASSVSYSHFGLCINEGIYAYNSILNQIKLLNIIYSILRFIIFIFKKQKMKKISFLI